MGDHDKDQRDDAASGDLLGGIARGPIVQSDTDRDLVRDREESSTSDISEERTRAEDRDRYGIPDPNRGLNVRD
jgi:hypothetical protein